MEIRAALGPVIGEGTHTHWAQTIHTQTVYGVIEIDDGNGGAQTLGMQIVKKIHEAGEKDSFSVHTVETLLDEEHAAEVVSLILFIPSGSNATILIKGEGAVYLKRDGHLAKLIASEGSISGVVKPTDMYFLATKTCDTLVELSELTETFDHLSAPEVAEKMALMIHTKTSQTGYAGVFLEITSLVENGWEPSEKKEEQMTLAERPMVSRSMTFRDAGRRVRGKFRTVQTRFLKTDNRILVVLGILLLVSVVVGVRHEMLQGKNKEAEKILLEANQAFDEGMALMDLNAVKAREKLLAAKNSLEQKQSLISAKTKEGRRAAELLKLIEENLGRATKSYEITPEVFYDVSLLKPGSAITAFDLTGDTIGVVDTKNKTVFSVGFSTKKGQIVNGGAAFDNALSLSIQGDILFILTPEGIQAVRLSDKASQPQIVKKSVEWGNPKHLVAFGGNLYINDIGKSRIWKYIRIEKKEDKEASASAVEKQFPVFSDMKEYLNPDTLPDLGKTTGLAIDGSVYLGTTDGKILRFTQGAEASLSLTGIDPPLGMSLVVYTDDALDHLYILDQEKKRIVVVDKEGIYTAQYHWTGAFAPTALVVSEKHGTILLLSDGKLYAVSLK